MKLTGINPLEGEKPLAIDLFCGLGGWTDGLLAENWRVVGFDNERHRYPAREIADSAIKAGGIDFGKHDSFNGTTEKRLRACPLTGGWHEYPAQLVLQDVLTLHGSQFRNAALIVASPPCQAYSYMAMPWSRAKREISWQKWARAGSPFAERFSLNDLFEACFRIQREACEAAGHHIPLVVENVKGAQPWVGRAAWHYGSFYLWGDVPALMPSTRQMKITGYSDPRRNGGKGAHLTSQHENDTRKNSGGSWFAQAHNTESGHSRNPVTGEGVKQPGHSGRAWFADPDVADHLSSHSSARKAASAQIAKIPLELARWVARVYRP